MPGRLVLATSMASPGSRLVRQAQALVLMSGENFLSHQFVEGLSHHIQVKGVADPQSHRQIAITNPTGIR